MMRSRTGLLVLTLTLARVAGAEDVRAGQAGFSHPHARAEARRAGADPRLAPEWT